MSKLCYVDKIEIYNERKNGGTFSYLYTKYNNIRIDNIKYLVRIIDKHGYDILRTSKNRTFSTIEKERIINCVILNNESVFSVAIDEGLLGNGILFNWIKKYKEMGYNIVKRNRGKTSTMPKKDLQPKVTFYVQIKPELEYSKKLTAVVQVRKNQQQKKK